MILAPKIIGFYFHGSHYLIEDVPVGNISRRTNVRSVVDSTLYLTVLRVDGVMRDRSLREVNHSGAFVVYENPGYNGAERGRAFPAWIRLCPSLVIQTS